MLLDGDLATRITASVEAQQTILPAIRRLGSTMDYAIDVTRTQIHLKTLDGEEIDATVFVHPVGHADYRPESVGDRLNDPDTRFIPCEIDGVSQLVRLSSISYALMTEPVPEVASLKTVGATLSQVELWLKSGDRLRGALIYEATRGEERVSDMLNRTSNRFLVLMDGQTTYFVLRDAVDRVQL